MNPNADDLEKGFIQQDVEHLDIRGLSSYSGHRLRPFGCFLNFNNPAISSIGAAFSSPISTMSAYILQDYRGSGTSSKYETLWDSASDLEAGLGHAARSYDQDGTRQSPSHEIFHPEEASVSSKLPLNSCHPFSRLSEVKRLFNSFARSQNPDLEQNNIQAVSQRNNPPVLYSPSDYSWDGTSATPPLTPDSFQEAFTDTPCTLAEDDENGALDTSHSRSLDIKEGKKPQRTECFSFLNDDTSVSSDSRDIAILDTDTPCQASAAVTIGDQNEWYGLEYTLELSCRERLPSGTKSTGEHSRSRESWAAIHQGNIDPFYEDEEYHEWKNWHHYLDRQDEWKRHKRGREFKAHSKDLAWIYVDEMRTRDIMYWQKEMYGVVAKDVKEHLILVTEQRPDPYFPLQKHGLSWYLKRSRSIACLRELQPRSVPEPQVRTFEDGNVYQEPVEDFYAVLLDGF